MNMRRFIPAVATIFIFALVWNGIVHLLLLKEADRALELVARPAADRSLTLGLLVTLGVAILFVYSYARHVRTPGLGAGLAHGALFGILAGLLVDTNQYLIYPIPGSLAAMWFVFGFAEFCIYGALASRFYPIANRGSSRDTH
ncbi:hypothetical protein [Endothiovibrio diazotrophicus]